MCSVIATISILLLTWYECQIVDRVDVQCSFTDQLLRIQMAHFISFMVKRTHFNSDENRKIVAEISFLFCFYFDFGSVCFAAHIANIAMGAVVIQLDVSNVITLMQKMLVHGTQCAQCCQVFLVGQSWTRTFGHQSNNNIIITTYRQSKATQKHIKTF